MAPLVEALRGLLDIQKALFPTGDELYVADVNYLIDLWLARYAESMRSRLPHGAHSRFADKFDQEIEKKTQSLLTISTIPDKIIFLEGCHPNRCAFLDPVARVGIHS